MVTDTGKVNGQHAKADIIMKSGYTRVVSQTKDVIHYEKDGKRFRRIGNILVQI